MIYIHDSFLQFQGSKKRNETNVSNLQFIRTYLSYLRQTLMIDRNLEMIENMKTKLPLLIGQNKQTTIKGKITKPEDLIRSKKYTFFDFNNFLIKRIAKYHRSRFRVFLPLLS